MTLRDNHSAATHRRTLPDRIADELISQVFTGELAAGSTLPAERRLAEELGVDRTSLRAAIRQLTRMNLLRPLRGSGITVLDYRRHAGVDFLAAVLDIPGLQLGSAFLIEALEHWNAVMPRITATAFARATPDTFRTLDAMLAQQLELIDSGVPVAEVAAIEIDMQDFLVGQTGDLTLQLMANSTRLLRRELTNLQLKLVDARAQVLTQRRQLSQVLGRGSISPQEMQAHAADLQARHAQLRNHLASLDPNPSRSTHWQKPERTRKAGQTDAAG